jgi:hypothetical protein
VPLVGERLHGMHQGSALAIRSVRLAPHPLAPPKDGAVCDKRYSLVGIRDASIHATIFGCYADQAQRGSLRKFLADSAVSRYCTTPDAVSKSINLIDLYTNLLYTMSQWIARPWGALLRK